MTREEEIALEKKREVMDDEEFVGLLMMRLAAKGLIYDTGERRDGQICWGLTPGKEEELRMEGWKGTQA